MITLKSAREIEGMRKSGALLAQTHLGISKIIKPGISSFEIEKFADDFITKNGGHPSEKGFEGYQYATCVCVNDEVAHAEPRKNLILKKGDIVKVDMTVELDGYQSDSCWCYAVGEISPVKQHLMEVTKKALYLGIDQAQVGNRLGDIGYAIQHYVEDIEHYGVVRDLIGHGIQPTMHEAPNVPHYGEPGKGLRLKEGMTITIEPMVNLGTWEITSKFTPNDWEYFVSADGTTSAQYEHTIAITKDGPKILTSQDPIADQKYL
ncbi:type I methionyl aminopeptidase [Bombilactobacillus thymidiniphilus]|uniref:Methionine aminopeptidase n=1 Tax=Bombilactobacillus thymidiniphilus TaxID=2923363 RepID=A0ABY4PCK7_9LACO|nr:type I methionyl aminopeptidase [Bombilactobacillus thymidiniphilus]UQS83251.1 type I methionyl aminopeptidase [Bombilactobacillus thymidiniphilus]